MRNNKKELMIQATEARQWKSVVPIKYLNRGGEALSIILR